MGVYCDHSPICAVLTLGTLMRPPACSAPTMLGTAWARDGRIQ